MPKKFGDLRQMILKRSKEILLKDGYKEFTMRTVANQCFIAVGTLYNYFPSKDMLLGCILFEDWQIRLNLMTKKCMMVHTIEDGLTIIFNEVNSFQQTYQSIWEECDKNIAQNGLYKNRHQMLIQQLSKSIGMVAKRLDLYIEEQYVLFLSESILLCVGETDLKFQTILQMTKYIISPLKINSVREDVR